MYKFTKTKDKTNSYDKHDVTFEIEDGEIGKDELKRLFDDFLRACGFVVSYDEDYNE